jgi:aspartyl/asparaginyl beta-hydroxylase (cupin superfamily)
MPNQTDVTQAQAANRSGMEALGRGDNRGAADAFRRAIAADPVPALWRNLATACRGLGDDAGEREALEGALAIDRTDFMAWLRKAELHERLGEDALALEAWGGVVQLAARLEPFPQGLHSVIEHGRAFIKERQLRLAAAVEAALGDDLASIEGAAGRRARRFVDRALGRQAIYTNECAGLCYPFLPADEFFDEEHFPWFGALADAAPAVRAELEALLAGGGEAWLRPYVELGPGTPANKWTPLDASLDWGACFLHQFGVPNGQVLARCPATAAMLEKIPLARIPGRSPNVFFSLLRPHTRIPPHTGVTNTRAIVHLPLIVPPGCGFRVGGETREWVEGRPFAFDDTIEHEAWNNSDQLRAVLILDVWNPHLSPAEQAAVERYYRAADATGLNPEPARAG